MRTLLLAITENKKFTYTIKEENKEKITIQLKLIEKENEEEEEINSGILSPTDDEIQEYYMAEITNGYREFEVTEKELKILEKMLKNKIKTVNFG